MLSQEKIRAYLSFKIEDFNKPSKKTCTYPLEVSLLGRDTTKIVSLRETMQGLCLRFYVVKPKLCKNQRTTLHACAKKGYQDYRPLGDHDKDFIFDRYCFRFVKVC